MKITLYNNHSEEMKLDKDIVKVVELEGFLREQTSLINPLILIELDPSQFEGTIVDDNHVYVMYNGVRITWNYFIYNHVLNANYCYIPDFNRYYFINDIISVRNNLWRIALSVDLYMSYKHEIRDLKALVTRNEYKYDPLVKDDEMTYYYDKDVIEIIPSDSGELINTKFETEKTHTRNVVLCCISTNNIPEYSIINSPDNTNLPDIRQSEYFDDCSEMCFIMSMSDLFSVSYMARNDDEIMSSIKSVVAYPFELDYSGTPSTKWSVVVGSKNIKIYGQATEDLTAYALKNRLSKYHITEDFIIERNNGFLDYDPFTKWELYIPYYGWISLSPDQVLNHRIIIYYTIQVEDGSANVYVYDVTSNKLIFTSTCQLGVRIGLSTTNNYEISQSKKANNLNLTLGLLSSVASVGVGAVTGNGVAVVGGVLSGAKAVTSYINNNSMMFEKAVATYGTGSSGMYTSQRAIIRKTILKPKDYNEEYFKLKGRPLNKIMKLKDLNGFTTIGDIHLENFGSATKQETELIKNLLEKGVIL